ncbi:MAG: hypothetical protein H6736_15380 [Alphaproteobacteria bacterium]|nr:hypothetical protein [Alphaproteobacteria bacterium]MCB9693191.1 hypothetical protein [Alphaproteobacteria bacterium]
MRTAAAIVTLLVGCDEGRPLVEAHRAGAGYAPENSRAAVRTAVDAGFEGIEVDLVVTADGAVVLNHDRTLDPERCVALDGSPVEPLELPTTEASALRGVTCGGSPSPDFPGARVIGEPLLDLPGYIELVRASDDRTLLHLDLKSGPDDDLELAAEAVLGTWFAADLPQPFYVSSPHPEVLHAFRSYGASRGHEVRTSLSWPVLDGAIDGLGLELRASLGLASVLRAVEAAGADGVALQWEVARREDVRALRAEGLDVQLWTLDDPRALRAHAGWPATSLITDFPGDLP